MSGLLNLGLTSGIPENLHSRNSDTTAWGGFELLVMRTNRYAGAGAMLSFGYGGVKPISDIWGKVIQLAACGELGTPLVPAWPSLRFTGSLGAGFMNGKDDDVPGNENAETNGRVFFSYGAILRMPVYSTEEQGGYALAPYISIRREHSHWLTSRSMVRNFADRWFVLGTGVTLFSID